jgi:hypothetical protein
LIFSGQRVDHLSNRNTTKGGIMIVQNIEGIGVFVGSKYEMIIIEEQRMQGFNII